MFGVLHTWIVFSVAPFLLHFILMLVSNWITQSEVFQETRLHFAYSLCDKFIELNILRISICWMLHSQWIKVCFMSNFLYNARFINYRHSFPNQIWSFKRSNVKENESKEEKKNENITKSDKIVVLFVFFSFFSFLFFVCDSF